MTETGQNHRPEATPAGPERGQPQRRRQPLFLVLAVLFSLGGVAAFVYLFVRDFNMYLLILAPVIIALYQVPAVFFFWLFKRSAARAADASPARGSDETDQPVP